jgi:hypothetical protein
VEVVNPSLLEEIQGILPTLHSYELRDIRDRIQSHKQRQIARINNELNHLDEIQLQALLEELIQQRKKRFKALLEAIDNDPELIDDPPFELEPSWFRMPRNEAQLQSMIEMTRANFDTESEP